MNTPRCSRGPTGLATAGRPEGARRQVGSDGKSPPLPPPAVGGPTRHLCSRGAQFSAPTPTTSREGTASSAQVPARGRSALRHGVGTGRLSVHQGTREGACHGRSVGATGWLAAGAL